MDSGKTSETLDKRVRFPLFTGALLTRGFPLTVPCGNGYASASELEVQMAVRL